MINLVDLKDSSNYGAKRETRFSFFHVQRKKRSTSMSGCHECCSVQHDDAEECDEEDAFVHLVVCPPRRFKIGRCCDPKSQEKCDCERDYQQAVVAVHQQADICVGWNY